MDSTERTEIADEREAIILAYQACLIDTLGGNVTAKQLEDELKSQGRDVSVTQEGENLIVTYNQTKRTYQVNQNGDVSQVANAAISISMEVAYNNVALNADDLPNVKEVTSENVPIPEGFYYVGGTKDTGLVISDVERDDLDNTLQGNQFVWVPVNQNQVLKIEVTSEENITGITLYNPNDTTQTLTASGKTFSQEIPINQNGTYELEVTTASGSQLKDLQVTSLYAQDMESWIDESMATIDKDDMDIEIDFDESEASEKYETTSDFLKAKEYKNVSEVLEKEENSILEAWNIEVPYPKILEKLYAKYGFAMYLVLNDILIRDRIDEMTNFYFDVFIELNKMALKNQISAFADNNQNTESVNKYGGFYIGRYETGGIGEYLGSDHIFFPDKAVVKKGSKEIIDEDFELCEELAENMYENNQVVKTQIISGAGWDRTMNWLIETGDKTPFEVYVDSSTWGNYGNAVGNAAIGAGEYTSTGMSEYWKANNIYDLAGNYSEMTQEIKESEAMCRGGQVRGGTCGSDSYVPAGMRLEDLARIQGAFRVQLFINV